MYPTDDRCPPVLPPPPTLAHGFVRSCCDDSGHDCFVANCCEGRCVCPSCNTRQMEEAAAHLTNYVFPHLPVRQWMLSVPKRLRHFTQRHEAVLNMVLRIYLRIVAQSLRAHCAGATQVNKAAPHIDAMAFIHRFGSSLNGHAHFHACVVDGVFEELARDHWTSLKRVYTGVGFRPYSRYPF